MHCPLCATDGGQLVWRGARLRVIQASEAAFPAFYRVVWNAHVAEFTDLSSEERVHCLQAVAWVEQVLRERLAPSKINLAALGNQVAHLHWHVIARFDWDSHFPDAVWAAPRRAQDTVRIAALAQQQALVHDALRARLENWAVAQSK
ncbi:MAG: HIT domain-containing protein [Comamonas sp. SCN 65-56]|uniref:HIT family protein n=1 Tax=Comamonas sp. SCN 65-56 TaxID=1660095 RepID=UPI00086AE076|nr:HIT family protein [Comamonas sp. SCN 65-56]ODS93535.1 MAG: HIT domain-containing protein [Comamonas sp. SCN 65-56]